MDTTDKEVLKKGLVNSNISIGVQSHEFTLENFNKINKHMQKTKFDFGFTIRKLASKVKDTIQILADNIGSLEYNITEVLREIAETIISYKNTR